MRGWFDAFRHDGGPTLYSYSNRTPVTGDPLSVTLYVIFFTVFAAFMLIFPGVRKEKFTTFLSVTLSLFVGTVILVSRFASPPMSSDGTPKTLFVGEDVSRLVGFDPRRRRWRPPPPPPPLEATTFPFCLVLSLPFRFFASLPDTLRLC
ncbi:unnamed protein product [Notodromas monacha]|uniref:Uncharacterized protein n=1 Tax=Notodromas monacha TaxID=399045 RepID=A0A7R9BQC7_9CRUS|nr:unnamed protein product [Notodromas monacha]CAG0918394.1 unnamed protein product [Notodromas monacha]